MKQYAPAAAATDWRQILSLYDQLLALAPSPVAALNRAVAVAEVEGPEAALAYEAAIARTGNAAERDFLRRSRRALTGPGGRTSGPR